MGFFEEFGELMKKYNLEIHAIQLDENVKIMNERFHLALKKQDLPPPIFLFRLSEGDFVPQINGPVSLNNEEKNIHFFNVKENSTFTLFPVEEKKEEPVAEELSDEDAEKVVTTLNALGDAIQNGMGWEEVPKASEVPVENVKKRIENKDENLKHNYFVVGNILDKDDKWEEGAYTNFIEPNIEYLQKFSTINSMLKFFKLTESDVKKLKLTSKEGKELLKKIEDKLSDVTDVVLLNDYKKSTFAKRIVKDLQAKGIEIIEEKDF